MSSYDPASMESIESRLESLTQKVEQIYASRTWKILTWLGGIGLLLAGRGQRSAHAETAPADPPSLALSEAYSDAPRGLSGANAPALVDLRSRVELHKGSGEWREVHLAQPLVPDQTAILICDMWDRHWCKSASRQIDGLVKEMARRRGMQIIHAPSDTMEFYRNAPQRKRMRSVARVEPPLLDHSSPPLDQWDPPLPIDYRRGCCCDTNDCRFDNAWTSEHAGLRIDAADVISDSGAEIYSFLRERGIQTLLVMGAHTNGCVFIRSFGIKRMTGWGFRCILVRDLADAWYSPQSWPFVSHEAGAELVVEYIEKHWCPTTTSTDLLRALSL
jgi:nicotinamidase-related amidase